MCEEKICCSFALVLPHARVFPSMYYFCFTVLAGSVDCRTALRHGFDSLKILRLSVWNTNKKSCER